MARKVTINLADTISTWKSKVQQMGDWVEDLDDLDPTFDPGDSPYAGLIDRDSNLVSALNYMGQNVQSILAGLFNGTTPISGLTAKIGADSGKFDKIHANSLYNYDSALPGPGNFQGQAANLWYGDSSGTIQYDFHADSAEFRNLTITNLGNYPDSMNINRLIITDSGTIGSITALDSTATIVFKNLSVRGTKPLFVDSALVLDRVAVSKFISDSGGDSGVNIANCEITGIANIQTLIFNDSDGAITFKHARPFLLTDSLGPNTNADSGEIYFAAIQLDIDNT
tara:strand:- start:4804 stop:5652 length:849 start_codon:yes stop_codon:yes gene_type:complete